MEIFLRGFRTRNSTSFIGRSDGLAARDNIGLDAADKDDQKYVFVIPVDTTSFNPSFYLGFLGNSMKALGAERFAEKYQFRIESTVKETVEVLQKNIKDGKWAVDNFLMSSVSDRIFY